MIRHRHPRHFRFLVPDFPSQDIPEPVLPWSEILAELESYGIECPYSPEDPDAAVLYAQAANWLAKHTRDYTAKVSAFARAAVTPGVWARWDRDGCLRVSGPLGTCAAAHDPYGQLEWALDQLGWEYQQSAEEWDGRRTQPWAFERLAGLRVTRARAIQRGNQASICAMPAGPREKNS